MLPAFAFGAANPSSSSHRPIAPVPSASSPPVPLSASTSGTIVTPQATCSSTLPPTAALTSSSTIPSLTTPLLLPLAPSPGLTLSSLLSSPPLPLHSLRPPLLTSMTPPHPPPRPTLLHPLPLLPPPLTPPLLCNGRASSSSSSSSRVLSSGSSSSSSRFRSRGSGSSSSSSRDSSRGSSSSRLCSRGSSSSRLSTEQLPAPPLSSSLACTLAPLTKSLEPLLPPPFSSLRTPMRTTSTPTIFTPSTFKEAIACSDVDRWIAAIFLECEAFIRNDSFVDVPLPTDANLVEGKWVFRVKQLPGKDLCKDLGDLTHYLGMAITRDRPAHTITLSQSHYIGQILEKFEMAQASPVATPLPFGHQLAPLTSPSSSTRPYAELVGSLMYAMMCTRPDLAYPISVLARFVGTGRHTECKDLGDLTHYLGMAITRDRPAHTITLSQSHYIGQILEKFEMAQASPVATPLPFGHQLAPPTSPSSSSHPYAELIGSLMYAMMCTRPDLAYPISVLARFVGTGRHTELCFLLAELGAPQPCPTPWCDNASTIHLTQDPVYHARSKHIELRYFFIRELVQHGLLAVRKIVAEANLADIFTKALLHPAHSALLRLIGLARPGAP
ncbi:unnamed protein product [Closterium sp. NIES-53]